jgi:Leucine-rich repeat (LRR) protein
VKDLGPLAALSVLAELSLHADSVESLAPLTHLTTLQHLSLAPTNGDGAIALRSLAGLQDKPRLRVVEISSAAVLVDVSALAHSRSLEGLSLEGCHELTDLARLGSLPSLKELDITACKGIDDLRFVTYLPSLAALSVAQTSITNLSALSACEQLAQIECWGMREAPIQGLAAVLALPQLRELILQEDQFPKGIQRRLRREHSHLLSRH